jgi:hypothetical protein
MDCEAERLMNAPQSENLAEVVREFIAARRSRPVRD